MKRSILTYHSWVAESDNFQVIFYDLKFKRRREQDIFAAVLNTTT